jgi:uncharacterized protein (DUF488 family)
VASPAGEHQGEEKAANCGIKALENASLLRGNHAILPKVNMVTAMALFTFGYEGQEIDGFIARLKKAGVTVVIDVRELPLSRKKGFSKTAFAAALEKAGIVYSHVPTFGCPKPIRNQYKIDGNWKRYDKAFNSYLATQFSAVAELAKFSNTTKACLVCFEADFNFCHRSLVARAAADAGGANVVHLTATTEIADRNLTLAA